MEQEPRTWFVCSVLDMNVEEDEEEEEEENKKNKKNKEKRGVRFFKVMVATSVLK